MGDMVGAAFSTGQRARATVAIADSIVSGKIDF
jgi:hypothetical protein